MKRAVRSGMAAVVGAASAYTGRRGAMQAGTRALIMIWILGVTLLTVQVFADTITWNVGGGVGGTWDTVTANWTGDPGGRNDNRYADGDAVGTTTPAPAVRST
jgi:hypothetical protein